MRRVNKDLWNDGDTYYQKCVYYNGLGRCAFSSQSGCIHEYGLVPFPYACGVEERAENEAMFGGEE